MLRAPNFYGFPGKLQYDAPNGSNFSSSIFVVRHSAKDSSKRKKQHSEDNCSEHPRLFAALLIAHLAASISIALDNEALSLSKNHFFVKPDCGFLHVRPTLCNQLSGRSWHFVAKTSRHAFGRRRFVN